MSTLHAVHLASLRFRWLNGRGEGGDELGVCPVRLMLSLLLCFSLVCPAVATPRHDVLFDVTFDMDHAGTGDRAVLVLVGPDRTDFSEGTKEVYLLGKGERADLLIYLNHGDGPLDFTKPPALRKKNLISPDELAFVMPLAVNQKGSLNVVSSNGFGNTFNTTHWRTGQWPIILWFVKNRRMP